VAQRLSRNIGKRLRRTQVTGRHCSPWSLIEKSGLDVFEGPDSLTGLRHAADPAAAASGRARAAEGRSDEPTVGIFDSHSVKGAYTVYPPVLLGTTRARRSTAVSECIITDTLGLLASCVMAASVSRVRLSSQ